MSDENRKLHVASPEKSSPEKSSPEKSMPEKPKREYADPLKSDRGGVGGVLENVLRRFKVVTNLALVLPVFALGCLTLGFAIGPGIAVFDFISSFSQGWAAPFRYAALGTAAACGFFTYGFSLLIVAPTVNFLLRAKLKPWRGPYYSLEAIRWFVHNGATYLARYTFLEFVTPTPFNLAFYRMMGMKIGRGTAINSTWISDPSLIELGEKVTIGGSVTIVAHYGQGGFLVLAPVKIGDRVTIGLKATIMGGVTIGDGAKVMPNSAVMPKTEIPAGETWGGVPARRID